MATMLAKYLGLLLVLSAVTVEVLFPHVASAAAGFRAAEIPNRLLAGCRYLGRRHGCGRMWGLQITENNNQKRTNESPGERDA